MDSQIIDQQFDQYVLRRLIGRGAMGIVYEAEDQVLHRRTAVKILSDEFVGHPELTARFMREARLAARIQHPNLVSVYSAGMVDGHPYLAMEFIEGSNLADIIKRDGHLSVDTAVEYLYQAALGIEAIHKADIVHRDVKPANMLVDTLGRIRVADFGLAKPTDDVTIITIQPSLFGTIPYMPPEQCRGEEAVVASDVYALGISAYEMIAGFRPYPARSVSQLFDQIQNNPPTPLHLVRSDIPKELSDAVAQMMDPNIKTRTPDMRAALDLLAPLRRVDAAEAVPARNAAPTVPIKSLQNPNAVPRYVAAFVNVIIAVLVVTALALGGGTSQAGLLGTIWHGTADIPYKFIGERPKHSGIVLLAFQDWPASPAFVAEAIREVQTAGAAVVGLDLILDESSSLGEGVLDLEPVVREGGNVVVVSQLTANEIQRPSPPIAAAAAGVGFANVTEDWDGVVRKMHTLQQTADGDSQPSFARVLTTKYNEFSGSDDRKAPGNQVQLDYRPAASMVPMAMIESNTETHPATVARRFPGFFEDKIVIIGANTPVDQHRTPLPGQYNILSGVTVQGIAVDNLLSGEALRRSPLLVSILITGIGAGLAYFLAKRTPAVFWVLSFCAIVAFYVGWMIIALRFASMVTPFALPVAAMACAFALGAWRRST